MQERIQKLISAAGLMSRRAAETLIADGRVKINGHTAAVGEKADPVTDTILVDGKPLLNKPRGYVTTMSDEKGRRDVTELVRNVPCRVYPVGRLDMYSEGLLLMTNDGDFANYMMHPSHNVDKTYLTRVEGEDIGLAMEYLREPMELDGYVVDGAEVGLRSLFPGGAELEITIHEGRNRQVRKMCEAVGLKVLRLKRISEDALELGELKPGAWRYLTPEELERVRPKGER